jgi:DNA invertase Pin-like site-specific DNA recombinase
VSLRILGMGVDTATPTGRLMVNLLGSIAQFKREVMLERQREGIARAKAEGKYKGRAPTARSKSEQIIQLVRTTEMTREEIARKVGVGVASVYRVLRAAAGATQIASALDRRSAEWIAARGFEALQGQFIRDIAERVPVAMELLC